MNAIAILTDFGVRDWYVAAMKGTILGVHPAGPLIDISHEVSPGNIASAAFILSQCWRTFPEGTVFLAVVDPGVGSSRAAVALEADGKFFVGPDNGLFGWLKDDFTRCHRIENTEQLSDLISPTFHGRDIFAPVAAQLAAGKVKLEELGPQQNSLIEAPWPQAIYEKAQAHGQILYIDHFGNAITNLPQAALQERYDLTHAVISLHPRHIQLLRTFSDAPSGQALAYFGSGGLLEIAVNGGNAAQLLDLRLDQHVELVL